MAITRLWQAAAEVDTTNSANIEFDYNDSITVSGTHRSGSYSFYFVTRNDLGYKNIASTTQFRLGAWVNFSVLGGIDANMWLVRFFDAGATMRAGIRSDPADPTSLQLYCNGSYQTQEFAPMTGVWLHLGIDVKFDAATGFCDVYFDGVKQMWDNDTNTGSTAITRVQFGMGDDQATNRLDFYIDDIYVDDTAGEAAAPVPDLRFEFISPDGAGNYSVWDAFPGTGEANWEDVDERPNDGDTTYVEAQVLNERDSYTMTTYAMAAGWAIQAVIPTAIAKKTDGGVDTEINLMTRQGGVDDDGSDQDLPSSYGLLWDRFPLDPGGGSWSQADLDSVECGYRGRGTF